MVVDVEKHEVFVWSQFDRSLATFAIGAPELVDDKGAAPAIDKHALAPLASKVPAEYALGRILFHAAGDGRIAHDGERRDAALYQQ